MNIVDINSIENIPDQGQSVMELACEHAQTFGLTPEPDEFDSRDVWDENDAIDAVHAAFELLADGIGPDGTQLADERESLLWGFVNMLDAQTQRLDRSADRLMPDLRDLQREQDGSEIKSRELELITDRAQNLTARRDAFEKMRDAAAQDYQLQTGNIWRPRSGSHTSQTGKLTSAAVDARDFMRARQDRKTQAHLPEGTLVAVTGGKDVSQPAAVFQRLDKVREKYTDILFFYLRQEAPWIDKAAYFQLVKVFTSRHGWASIASDSLPVGT